MKLNAIPVFHDFCHPAVFKIHDSLSSICNSFVRFRFLIVFYFCSLISDQISIQRYLLY